MALSDSAPAANLVLGLKLNIDRRGLLVAGAWSLFLTLFVAGPWLWQAGYMFGTDFPGPRRFDWPTSATAEIPIETLLALSSGLITAEVTGKLLYLAVLFVAAFAAYQAVPVAGFFPRAAASAIYVFNPFVFGRLHYGQLFLVAGYAVLPWAATALRGLCREPSWRSGVLFGVSVSVIAVFTVHLFLVAWVLAVVACLTHIALASGRLAYARRLLLGAAAAAGATFVLCAYWLAPFVLGRSVEARIVGATGSGELNAYAVVPDAQLGLLPNLLGLYGFWAENTGRFTSMKAFVPLWPVALLLVLAVALTGAIVGLRRREDNLAAWTVGLLVAAAIALVLEVGVSHSLTAGLVRHLDSTVPLYRGMRDAGKWAALLALVYSQLVGLGSAAILGWIRSSRRPSSEWLAAAAAGLLLALTLYYGNGLFFGMHGEVRPSQYPAGWYAADRALLADPHHGRALFLPWHEYLSYSFIKNQNNVVACPGSAFFSVPIVASANPEVPGVAPPNDPDQAAIDGLVAKGLNGHWASVLATRGIKYVLVAKEVDWKTYQFLDAQPGLVLVADYGSIKLYRVNEKFVDSGLRMVD